MDSPLALFGFLSIFHVIGAVALAKGVRGIWNWLHEKERGLFSCGFSELDWTYTGKLFLNGPLDDPCDGVRGGNLVTWEAIPRRQSQP